ncbi:hypothetical protein JNW91_15515 [Micromonospora sp. STR1_7]|uniref:Uncharacterized protein n=1 Tax=Micromonospora parastrephiae TaxID=2806101 RepID=A0ABS1XV39_9ACTN|nr:hypothetical protein [Micromonospora parastrephiae]MBM0233146.1 hypothetical protein [Micromonospora parastrephiae]
MEVQLIIDERVEQLVRDTLHWAVKRQPAEFDEALKTFSDVPTQRSAMELLVAISAFVAVDMCGGKPSPVQIRELATEVAEAEDWSSATPQEVEAFLSTILTGRSLSGVLPAGSAVVLAFVVAASLLSSRPKSEGEWWFNYLDKVEAAIEAAG